MTTRAPFPLAYPHHRHRPRHAGARALQEVLAAPPSECVINIIVWRSMKVTGKEAGSVMDCSSPVGDCRMVSSLVFHKRLTATSNSRLRCHVWTLPLHPPSFIAVRLDAVLTRVYELAITTLSGQKPHPWAFPTQIKTSLRPLVIALVLTWILRAGIGGEWWRPVDRVTSP